MITYGLLATAVFLYGLQAFLRDQTTPNTHVPSWTFLVLMALLWPLVLPSMVQKQAKRFNDTQSATEQASEDSYQGIAS